MSHHSRTAQSADCTICMGLHDEEIHTATLNVRQWFRGVVTLGFGDEAVAGQTGDEIVEVPVVDEVLVA